MKITIESTTKIVSVKRDGDSWDTTGYMECRVWEGVTANGVPVQCLIARIAAQKGADLSEFERELQEQSAPSAEVSAFPLMIIL